MPTLHPCIDRPRPSFAAALALAAGLAGLALPAQADTAVAAQRCEAAVAETVRQMRADLAREVVFRTDERLLLPAADDEIGVRGEGRYRSAKGVTRTFTYSCAYNARTATTSGVMFREVGPAPALARTAAWEPDMAHVSPSACEAAASDALREKYPRVVRIAFDSRTRQLRQAGQDGTSLEGLVAVQRAPGMSPAPVAYRCVFDSRSGRMVQVDTLE